MPLDPSISLNIKPVDTMGKLSDMLGIAQGAQAYQANQLGLTKARALLQPEINQGIAHSQSAQAQAQVDTATVQPKIAQQNAFTSQQQTAAKSAATDYQTKQFDIANDAFNSMAQDPRLKSGDPAKIKEGLDDAYRMAIGRGADIESTSNLYHGLLKTDPAQLPQVIANHTQALIGAQGQVTQNQIPAGNRQTVTLDSNGNPQVSSKSQTGDVQAPHALPGAGNGTPPPVNYYAPGEKDNIPQLTAERNAARQAALNAGVQHNLNDTIINNIDNVEATGTVGGPLQKAMSAIGAVFTGAEDKASAYDLIGKAQERQALTAAASMGPQTNANLEAQIKANGSTAYNPTAIKRIAKLNDALTSGQEAYSRGLEAAIASNPQRGVLMKQGYDQQWGSVFRPEVMELQNALKRGDKAEVSRIVQEAGGAGSAGAKDLMGRYQAMKKLSSTGSL